MADSGGHGGAVPEMVGWFTYGLLATLVFRYAFNLYKARELAAQLHKRRPSLSIPQISFVQDVVGSMLAAATFAPVCFFCVFLVTSCTSFFNDKLPPPDWATFWRSVGFVGWPFCTYAFIWPRNRYVANLRTALDGAILLADGAGGLHRFALYLRSVTGDRRTIYTQTGPDGQAGDVPVQPAVLELKSILGRRVKIFALWDPHRDARPSLHFSPVLSSDAIWKEDVIALAKRALFIAADFEADRHGRLSQGVTWEIQLLLEFPALLGKTLVIVSAGDEPSDQLAEVIAKARWKVEVTSRDSYGANFREVPSELLELILKRDE